MKVKTTLMTKPAWPCGYALCGALLMGAAQPASAQAQAAESTEADSLDEIVVTAQKREQNLRDVPVSITAFSSETIEKQRITSLQDYSQLTPNLGFFTEGNSLSQKVAIRGVTNLGGYVNSLAVYVDEFNVTPGRTAATYEQYLLDLERVEILRGPQGVFFGRNVIGGAISQTTRKPSDRFEASVTAEYGNFGTYLVKGMVNLPASERAAFRLTGFRTESDGFLDDVGPADNTNDYDVTGGRVALRLKPSDAVTIDLAASHVEQNQGIETLLPTGQLFPVLTFLGVTPVDDGQGFYPSNDHRIATDEPSSSFNDTSIATARIEWDLGAFSVVSVSGYLKNDAGYSGEGDMSAGHYATQTSSQSLRDYSTELRAQSNGEGAWRWVFGASYAHDKSRTHALKNLYPDFYTLFHLGPFGFPDPFPAPAPVVRITDVEKPAKTDSYGVFGNIDWLLADDRLTLSLGGRYSHDRVALGFIDLAQNLFTGLPSSTNPATYGSASFQDFSPRASALYKITPRANVYASISKGYKPGGFNNVSLLLPQIAPEFDPEIAWNYEAGFKGAVLDDRLQSNLSLFYMKWRDIQVDAAFFDATTFNTTHYIANGAAASSRGVELDLVALPMPGLQLEASLGYNRARFDDFEDALDMNGVQFDASGNTLPLAPKRTTTLAAEYGHGVGADRRAFVRAEYIDRGLTYTSFDAIPLFDNVQSLGGYVPAYHTWNLRLGLQGERYSAVAFVENVGNDDYVVGGRLDNFTSGNPVVLSPRRYGLRVTYDFK